MQREVCGRLIERLVDTQKKPASILDLGAGTGTTIRALQQQHPESELVALDFAASMLLELRQNAGQLLAPDTVCADAADLPFSPALFDLVFSSLTLQWCDDLLRVFREVRRVLTTNGLFLFATLGPDSLYELRNSWAAVDNTAHVNTFVDMHEVGDALLSAGFSDPVVDVERIVLSHRQVDVLLRSLKALGANTVLGERRRSLTGRRRVEAMVKAYEQYRSAEGDYLATFEVIFGIARQSTNQQSMRYFSADSLLNKRY